MMILDNKKWYKKYATIFWFSLAIMPILITLIQTIGSYIIHWGDSVSYTDINSFLSTNGFWLFLEDNATRFGNFTPTTLKDAYSGLFNSWGGITQDSQLILGYIFGWFTFTYLIHIIVDVMIWLPKLFHSWLERWC